jgi:hypothetical protein
VATLTFDSYAEALPAGVRSAAGGARQLVYQVPPLLVDLRLEAVGRSGRIVLAGQIGNGSDQVSGSRARVAVLDGLTELAAVTANDFGEFQCDFEPRTDMLLSISLEDGADIAIPLDRLPVE